MLKIAYQCTIDDRVNNHLRLLEVSGAKKQSVRNALSVAMCITAVTYFISPDNPARQTALALAAGAAYFLYAIFGHRRRTEQRLREYFVYTLGTHEPVHAECELNENGLTFRGRATETLVKWDCMVVVEEREDVIEIVVQEPDTEKISTLAHIPSRIFSSTEERNTWLAYINEHKPNADVE